MGGRSQAKLPRDDQGYDERIRRADERTGKALSSSLAQRPAVVKMGTTLRLDFILDHSTQERSGELSIELVDNEALAILATKLRPFVLERESIYYRGLIKGLRRFADTDQNKIQVEQLLELWDMCSRSRMTARVSSAKKGQLIPGGAGGYEIADRVLYSQIVHADDASDILEHISEEWQQWTLATLVGDWAATVAHQQYVMHCVRPDLVPELTKWAGDYLTIFRRFGLETKQFEELAADHELQDDA